MLKFDLPQPHPPEDNQTFHKRRRSHRLGLFFHVDGHTEVTVNILFHVHIQLSIARNSEQTMAAYIYH